MAASIDQYLQSLRGAFSQLSGGTPQQQPAPASPRTMPQQAPNDAYQRMVAQALSGKSYKDMFPVQAPYTPPPPPAPAPAAPAPQAAAEAPYSHDYGAFAPQGGGDASDYKRGGRITPTEAQKRAGNYIKQHLSFHGLPISIETPKGATREGKDHTGKVWRCKMPADYGYIKRTEGADGDHLDVFVGPDRGSRMVFLINQNDHRTGKFDEHKAILGTTSERQAVALYCAAFSDGCGAKRIGSIEPMSLDAFKHWLKQGKTKTPAKAKTIVEHALAVTRSKT
ncbi:hypothetical protein UFOVP1413_36 [uncultured Caudovirales phage]|uniref:Inorganic pyrophosphatase domain-containing protein n=1 Tax=uncultured Caudovirales phage TaxID=2100421 RepID=A0A6J5PBJ4_9CAUD|nr:hypothetical protein UFOVP893_2 [uncultured Caudovirales phage]CAB4210651.1 hypothetical protein UFOVP1413_36 [uncultured Caudovirales phage]